MGTRRYTACTPSRRNTTGSDFVKITRSTSEKSLVVSKKKHAGRGAQGKIMVRHRGGGARRKYRIIDFKRDSKDNIPAKVVAVEYDPNRTANITLLCYADGAKAYILVPQDLTVGQTMMNGDEAKAGVDSCPPLTPIPVGSGIHNIELYPGKSVWLACVAGITVQSIAKRGKYTTLRLPSDEIRVVPINRRVTMDSVGNGEHNLISLSKAGRKRHMGIRPTVHGSVMNPNNHPYGDGEGRASIGRPGPYTPRDRPAMGLETRKKNKQSNKLIVRRRNGKA